MQHQPVTVILGSQWGDEGKGKLVDLLASDFDVVARCAGGGSCVWHFRLRCPLTDFFLKRTPVTPSSSTASNTRFTWCPRESSPRRRSVSLATGLSSTSQVCFAKSRSSNPRASRPKAASKSRIAPTFWCRQIFRAPIFFVEVADPLTSSLISTRSPTDWPKRSWSRAHKSGPLSKESDLVTATRR